jgi:hypothetical protein
MTRAFYEHLSPFWNHYENSNELATIWSGYGLVYDNEYISLFEANLSKSLFDIPVLAHKQWVNLELNSYTDNMVNHDHSFEEFIAAGGENFVTLTTTTPPDLEENLFVYKNGDKLLSNTDYTYSTGDPQKVNFTSPLIVSDVIWVETFSFLEPKPHTHKYYEEVLTAPKSVYTSAPGDAFDPAAAGPYQAGDASAPIQVWINGSMIARSLFTEDNTSQLTLLVATSANDVIQFRWIRDSSQEAEQHKHVRYRETLSSATSSIVLDLKTASTDPLGVDLTRNIDQVFVNGVLKQRIVDYNVVGKDGNTIQFTSPLAPTNFVDIVFFYEEFLFSHVVDETIVSSEFMQDGILDSSVVLNFGTDFTFSNGFLLTNMQIADAWYPDMYVDEDTIYNNFGNLIDFRRPSSQQYKDQVAGLFSVLWNGSAVKNIENGAKIILGLPFAITPTTVLSVTDDGAAVKTYTVELANGQIFTFKDPIQPIVNTGDELSRYAAITTGVQVLDDVNSPDWYKKFPGFYQSIGVVSADDPEWTFSGYWDDCGFLDDNGIFDIETGITQARLDEINSRLYQAFKHHMFLVLVDSTLLDDDQTIEDLSNFLENIKPSYTEFLLVSDVPDIVDVQPKPSDSIMITLF